VATMLAGADVTEAALSQARSLLHQHQWVSQPF
jgi:DNA repair ATPase RecN